MASPRRSTKRRSSKRKSPKSSPWIRKLQAWRKANRHVDGSLPSMKSAMKHCKGRSSRRSKCRKNQGRKPSPKRSSKRRSTRRKSPKRSSKRRSTRRKSPKRKSSKRRSTRRKSPKRKSSKRRSTRRKSPRRRSPIRKLRKYYPSFVGKRFQKFERPSSMPQYAAPAAAPAAPAYTGPTLLLGDISDQQKEERLKEDQAYEAATNRENLYAALEIQKTDSQDEIKRAYRKVVLKNHPDKGGDVEKFKQIGKAYRILTNPRAKKAYDDAYKPGIFA